jgi:hypothetical protein
MRICKCAFTAIVLVAALSIDARADVVNGGFESGAIAPWVVAGQGLVRDSSFGVTPTHGTYAGYIDNTGNGTILAADMDTALHLPAGTVNTFVSGTPTRGSVIYQNVVVAAGSTLSFDWNFMSDELHEDPIFDDFAFYSVVGATSGIQDSYLLASRNSSTFSSSAPVGFDGITGWETQTYYFPTSDTYRIGFGVMNVTDGGYDSAIMLDGIVVPEPAAGILIGIVIPMLPGRRRRRSRQEFRILKSQL